MSGRYFTDSPFERMMMARPVDYRGGSRRDEKRTRPVKGKEGDTHGRVPSGDR